MMVTMNAMTVSYTHLDVYKRQGQYGEEGIFASTPAVIGKDGIEDVFELQLTNEELALFKASCAVIREHVAKAEAM